ncbi:MAG: FecR domain-containing protein [Opitutaceae bacterium]
MSPPATPPTHGAPADQAAAWLARGDAGFTAAEQAAFDAWLAADRRHQMAVAELDAAWGALNRPRLIGQAAPIIAQLAARARTRRQARRTRFTYFAGSLAAAALALAAFPFFSPDQKIAASAPLAGETIVARPERQLLADGSVVQLNAGAEIVVAYSFDRREVTLLRGEAHFSVTKDPSRPFIVTASGVEARAVGTEFSVSVADAQVDVLVNEGRVAVARALLGSTLRSPDGPVPPPMPIYAEAGTRVTVPLAGEATPPPPAAVEPAELARALAWRKHRVEFSGTPLGDAVALFNRSNTRQLTFADPALAQLRVSGVFWIDQPEGFARLLGTTFGLRHSNEDSDLIVLRR